MYGLNSEVTLKSEHFGVPQAGFMHEIYALFENASVNCVNHIASQRRVGQE